ncbi:Uncharacterised protein [Mycobacteroides abscessus subsp. abscessus]|nr:Uncharacterised protein [Mycobacteroides abscessus subsp. abscessus]
MTLGCFLTSTTGAGNRGYSPTGYASRLRCTRGRLIPRRCHGKHRDDRSTTALSAAKRSR